MTGRMWRLVLVGLVFAAQLAAPSMLAWRHERALRQGTRHLFKCISRDPVDVFRGRYLDLNLDALAPGVEISDLPAGHRYYGRLRQMEDGYARIVEILERPPTGEYVTLRTNRWSSLELPFDRYYLNETIAPQVDEIFRDDLRAGRIEVVLAVRILRGTSTLEELLLDGEPVADYVRKQSPPSTDAEPERPMD